MTTENKRAGFGGQWIEIIVTGAHTDSTGKSVVVDAQFIEQAVKNYNPELHEAPAVVGHPKTDAPAYGWVCGLRANNEKLEALFCDTDPAFETLVKEGKFKKRSSAFYLDEATAPGGLAPYLRHVGFLGAQPPAVKGLRDVHFEEGETVTFEETISSEGESMDEKDVKKTVVDSIKEFFATLGGKKEEGAQAAFSEAEFNERVKKAVETATAPLTTKLATLETDNNELREAVKKQTGKTTRAEIAAFCESLGKGKCPPAFLNIGLVEFMESLDQTTEEKKVTVVTFSEEGGEKKEVKTESSQLAWFKKFMQTLKPMIEFGEQYGALQTSGEGAQVEDPEEMKGLRRGAGVKGTQEGGSKDAK